MTDAELDTLLATPALDAPSITITHSGGKGSHPPLASPPSPPSPSCSSSSTSTAKAAAAAAAAQQQQQQQQQQRQPWQLLVEWCPRPRAAAVEAPAPAPARRGARRGGVIDLRLPVPEVCRRPTFDSWKERVSQEACSGRERLGGRSWESEARRWVCVCEGRAWLREFRRSALVYWMVWCCWSPSLLFLYRVYHPSPLSLRYCSAVGLLIP